MEPSAISIGGCVPAEFSATSAASFAHACHLVTDDGSLVFLLAEGLGPSPNAIVLPAQSAAVLATADSTTTASLTGGRLTVVSGSQSYAWQTAAAPLYEGTVSSSAATPRREEVEAAADAVVAIASSRRAREVGSLGRMARERVADLLGELVAEVQGQGDREPSRIVERLVGLGPGLTPSGDDALVGFLAACWALRGTGGRVARAVSRTAGATSSVSESYLKLAADGLFAEPLASLARSVALGDVESARRAATRCLAHGATSGADAVSGFLAGCTASLPVNLLGSEGPSCQ